MDQKYSRENVTNGLDDLVKEYERLRVDFRRLWLAEDCENDGFYELDRRFDITIGSCREKAEELRK